MLIASHRTAMKRNKASAPLCRLHSLDLLKGRVLDYGCGHGGDVEYMRLHGMDVCGYDPYWQPDFPIGSYDTITCTYVLNVVDVEEEKAVIERTRQLLSPGGKVFFSVRRDLKGFRNPNVGCVTSRGMQRYVDLSFPVTWEKRGSYCIYSLPKG